MSRHHRLTPREAMHLYRAQRLREDEARADLNQVQIQAEPEGKSHAPNEFGTQEKTYDQVGRQDAITRGNRKGWKAQQASLEGDQDVDATAMAEKYLRIPGAQLPAPGNLAQTLASSKDHRIQHRRVNHKPSARRGGGGLLPHLGSLKKADGTTIGRGSKAKVLDRPHAPIHGSIAIV